MTTKSKLALLTSLYLAQGLPFGFFTQALPVIMRQQGMSLESIGFSSLLALPWALKLLWAPLVDKHYSNKIGRRRSWILPLQFMSITLMIIAAMFDAKNEFTGLIGLIFIVNLLASTQDIATDGLAVELLSQKERGLGNGIQVAGYRLGMIIGGGALLVVFEKLGWRLAFFSMAIILAIATIPIFLHSEKKTILPESHAQLRWKDFLSFFKTRDIWLWIIGLFFYKSGDAFATQMLRPLLVDMKYSMSEIGGIVGTIGFGFGLIGSLLGGWLVNTLARRKSLLTFSLLQTVTILGYFLMANNAANSIAVVYALSALEHFCGGLATVAIFTVMMDKCNPNIAATDYTIQACIVVISTGVFSALSGISANQFGYAGHFIIAAILSFLGFIAIYFGSKHLSQSFISSGKIEILES